MKKLLLILLCVPLIGTGQETGCISGDCINGYGTLTFADGKITGEWKNGKANGQGIITWDSGDKYVGEFKDNKKEGL